MDKIGSGLGQLLKPNHSQLSLPSGLSRGSYEPNIKRGQVLGTSPKMTVKGMMSSRASHPLNVYALIDSGFISMENPGIFGGI